jgi:radical SAM protein with 4Fe4S-binding SPASM domain
MRRRMVKRRLEVVPDNHYPAYVVWELTLRCDQPCAHCGSRAGVRRPEELTTEQALDVVRQLKEMRAEEVVVIGGEAYLHEGFLDIVRALKAAGIRPSMTTGGRGITAELARDMKAAGLTVVSVSVDGMRAEHNQIRKAPGSWESALAALDHLRAAGIPIAANTNINRVNAPVLEQLFELLRDRGVRSWQVQITVPLGRAADRPQMLLQPYDLLDVVPRLAALKKRAFANGMIMMPGNNLGYFGVHEALLRSPHESGKDHWQGCQAGKLVLGIESDGGVKGCPSLQSSHYIGGSLKERSLEDIWRNSPELNFNRARSVDDLWGYCATCPFADVCKGGCTFTAHALFGKPGNNPYCHYRAQQLAHAGQRERLVATEAASGKPFDHGLFEIVLEAVDAQEPRAASADLVAITRAPQRQRAAV